MSGWAALDRLLDEAPGSYSACVQRPRGAPVYAYAADVVRPAASLIKLPLAMALAQANRAYKAGGNGVDLDATVVLRETDRARGDGADEGSFDIAPAGTARTGWQLIDHALRESDNTAANLLIGALGMDEVNRWMRSAPLHLSATRLQRRFIDFAAAATGRENWTTAREMCLLLRALHDQANLYAPLVESLLASDSPDALVAGLPPQVPVAHKVGGLPGIEHDAGIVYAPDGPYIVALLSQNLPDTDAGKAVIAEASCLIYARMTA